jgi:hypothetical protein
MTGDDTEGFKQMFMNGSRRCIYGGRNRVRVYEKMFHRALKNSKNLAGFTG